PVHSTSAGGRNGRRWILTSLSLSAMDTSSLLRLKLQSAVFENVIGNRFRGDDTHRLTVTDNRHVTITAHRHFVDDHAQRIAFADRLRLWRHHFADRQPLQIKLTTGDFVEQ